MSSAEMRSPYGGFGVFLYRHCLQLDVLAHACALDVALGDGDGFRRIVGTVDFIFKLALGGVVVVDGVEKLLVEVGPVLESEVAAEHAWIDVAGNQGCLDEECARSAHRVDEVALSVPAGFQNQSGGEHLVDRRVGLHHAVSAFVERLS